MNVRYYSGLYVQTYLERFILTFLQQKCCLILLVDSTDYLPYLLLVAKETFLPCVYRRILLSLKKSLWGQLYIAFLVLIKQREGKQLLILIRKSSSQTWKWYIYLKTCLPHELRECFLNVSLWTSWHQKWWRSFFEKHKFLGLTWSNDSESF